MFSSLWLTPEEDVCDDSHGGTEEYPPAGRELTQRKGKPAVRAEHINGPPPLPPAAAQRPAAGPHTPARPHDDVPESGSLLEAGVVDDVEQARVDLGDQGENDQRSHQNGPASSAHDTHASRIVLAFSPRSNTLRVPRIDYALCQARSLILVPDVVQRRSAREADAVVRVDRRPRQRFARATVRDSVRRKPQAATRLRWSGANDRGDVRKDV